MTDHTELPEVFRGFDWTGWTLAKQPGFTFTQRYIMVKQHNDHQYVMWPTGTLSVEELTGDGVVNFCLPVAQSHRLAETMITILDAKA